MGYYLFKKLTESELNIYLDEIDLVIEFHIKWLSEVNRALICHTESDALHVKNSHNSDDYFNRWYNSSTESDLIKIPAFKVLKNIHTEIIALSHELLSTAVQDISICTTDYDRLISLATELRHQINIIKTTIKSNLKLVAMLMGKVFENAEEGVMITDENSHILNVNQAFVRVTQYTKEEVLGKTPKFLHSGTHDEGFYERMWSVLIRDGRWQGEIWNKRKNNENYPEWLSIIAVNDDDSNVRHYIGIFSDVSTESEGNERLYRLAHYDSLCDLPNRMLFYDRLRQELLRSKRSKHKIAVMFMDLDDFKNVNDDYGHVVGDELLQQVSKRVVKVLRESDTIARIGGDEFTLIITDFDNKKSVTKIATKILSTIQESYSLQGNKFTISASIGISMSPDDSEDINMLVKQADIAMYKAKREGKNCYKFYDKLMG